MVILYGIGARNVALILSLQYADAVKSTQMMGLSIVQNVERWRIR
jgi:hypothetical protein